MLDDWRNWKNVTRSETKMTDISTRRLYQNIILIHMTLEEKKECSSDNLFSLWYNRQEYSIAKWEDRSYMSLPKTASQLLRVIQNSGYPGISKHTLYECLDELVELQVLMKFKRTGTHKKYNQTFYALPFAIDFWDHTDYQRRRYYIPWTLTVSEDTMEKLVKYKSNRYE